MNNTRKLELYRAFINRIVETASSRADAYNTLNDVIGMSEEEIREEVPSIADFIDDTKNIRISAFIQYERNSLVIPLPTSLMNLALKLESIGLQIQDDPYLDDPRYGFKLKLMTENNTGCYLIKLFSEKNTLMEVSKTIHDVMSVPDEIWPELRKRLISGKYSSCMDLLSDITEMVTQLGKHTTTFYFPLVGTLESEDSEDDSRVSNRYLKCFRSEIELLIDKEHGGFLGDMKDFFYDDDNAQKKMASVRWGVEEIDGVLYGKVDFRLYEPFTPEEKEKVRDWIEGQNSDGFGEGLEQRKIETEDGDLYISLWYSGEDYFVYDKDELSERIGGIRQI